MGDSLKLVGRGLKSGMSYDPVLSPAQLAELEISPEREPLDGNPERFRLGIEAARLALAYEYDPFFSLSVSTSSGATCCAPAMGRTPGRSETR